MKRFSSRNPPKKLTPKKPATGDSKNAAKSAEKKVFKEYYDDLKEEKYDEDEDEMEIMALEQKTRLQIKKEVDDLDEEQDAPLITCDDELEELEKLEMQQSNDTERGGTPHSIHELFEAIKNGLYAEVATLLG